jgi:hypothetical protein
VNALRVEPQIWADVEYWIRHPGEALKLLAAEQQVTSEQQEGHRAQLAEVQRQLDALQSERDTVVREYRKGRIDERTYDRQLDEIAREEAGHVKTRESLLAALQDATDTETGLATARDLLMTLRATMDSGGPLTPERQREIVTKLVREIRVYTEEVGLNKRTGRIKRRAVLHVTYRFARPEAQLSSPDRGGADEVCSASPSAARSAWRNLPPWAS